jgi:prephenate dehydrogenase
VLSEERLMAADVLVLGCGLIGTSIGMAVGSDADVLLFDVDAERVALAVRRGAGRAWDGRETVTTVVVAVPPHVTATQLFEAQARHLARTYTHVASVQSQVQYEVEALGCDLSTVVGGHPLAGRESSGPAAAVADLFVGRPWALCALPESSLQALEDVRHLAQMCGAEPVELGAEAHDAAVALLSHLPQVAASALAGLLENQGAIGTLPTALSGPGLVDTTRLAASDPALWTQILQLNAAHVAPVVQALARELAALGTALEELAEDGLGLPSDAAARVHAFLVRGNQGRALVPVKRGELSDAFGRVRISVDDEPGRLAALLTAAGSLGVNVEDVHVEHVPGKPQGVIELLVGTERVDYLGETLIEAGWRVLGA